MIHTTSPYLSEKSLKTLMEEKEKVQEVKKEIKTQGNTLLVNVLEKD